MRSRLVPVHTAMGTWELNENYCGVARNRRSLLKGQADIRVCYLTDLEESCPSPQENPLNWS